MRVDEPMIAPDRTLSTAEQTPATVPTPPRSSAQGVDKQWSDAGGDASSSHGSHSLPGRAVRLSRRGSFRPPARVAPSVRPEVASVQSIAATAPSTRARAEPEWSSGPRQTAASASASAAVRTSQRRPVQHSTQLSSLQSGDRNMAQWDPWEASTQPLQLPLSPDAPLMGGAHQQSQWPAHCESPADGGSSSVDVFALLGDSSQTTPLIAPLRPGHEYSGQRAHTRDAMAEADAQSSLPAPPHPGPQPSAHPRCQPALSTATRPVDTARSGPTSHMSPALAPIKTAARPSGLLHARPSVGGRLGQRESANHLFICRCAVRQQTLVFQCTFRRPS